jgi:hypothetical protein
LLATLSNGALFQSLSESWAASVTYQEQGMEISERKCFCLRQVISVETAGNEKAADKVERILGGLGYVGRPESRQSVKGTDHRNLEDLRDVTADEKHVCVGASDEWYPLLTYSSEFHYYALSLTRIRLIKFK